MLATNITPRVANAILEGVRSEDWFVSIDNSEPELVPDK